MKDLVVIKLSLWTVPDSETDRGKRLLAWLVETTVLLAVDEGPTRKGEEIRKKNRDGAEERTKIKRRAEMAKKEEKIKKPSLAKETLNVRTKRRKGREKKATTLIVRRVVMEGDKRCWVDYVIRLMPAKDCFSTVSVISPTCERE